MVKQYFLPALLIACMASAATVIGDSEQVRYTHGERVHLGDLAPEPEVSKLEAGLPQSWCGTKSQSDQTVNAVANDAPKFKFYYVRASDTPDRFEAAANMLQKSISTIHSYLINVSAGKRTVSLDLGTTCGPLYADISALTLPGGLGDYLDSHDEIDVNATMNALESFTDSLSGPPRHYIFLLDQFEFPDYISGIGQMALDDSPGAGNFNNMPGLVAYVATPEGPLDEEVAGELPRALLHEMTHTMGGVQGSAPNSTSAGHCTDGLDVMCYPDGSPEAAGYNPGVCPSGGSAGIAYAYDCQNDDYFNSSPSAGSHLAKKWNVFNSKYLVDCSVADPYCTAIPSSDPSPDNPAARTATNKLYLYKKGRRVKSLGTVAATGALEPGTPFVRNSVKMTNLAMPKGKWKVTLCFRENGKRAVCESRRQSTSASGYVAVPRIYVTTSRRSAQAWGSVSIKAISGKNKKKRVEVRTDKKLVTYSLAF